MSKFRQPISEFKPKVEIPPQLQQVLDYMSSKGWTLGTVSKSFRYNDVRMRLNHTLTEYAIGREPNQWYKITSAADLIKKIKRHTDASDKRFAEKEAAKSAARHDLLTLRRNLAGAPGLVITEERVNTFDTVYGVLETEAYGMRFDFFTGDNPHNPRTRISFNKRDVDPVKAALFAKAVQEIFGTDDSED